MAAILNLTQHAATPAQIEAGVIDVHQVLRQEVSNLLTFEDTPHAGDVRRKAMALAALAASEGYESAMIGGAPYLMGPLEAALKAMGVKPMYAFSVRESVENTLPDGKVVKTAVFRHLGFGEA